MRGGALCSAARLFCCLSILAVPPAGAQQAPVRTRDVGFATVGYDNGLTLGALTLTEGIVLERPTGSLFGTGLVSLFNDGRWSMQGTLGGSRLSAPIRTAGVVAPWFHTIHGELGLSATSTAQQGFMPTLQLTSQARLHLSGDSYAARASAALARTFDGFAWRTTVIGEAGGWARLGSSVLGLTATPMQLQYGDLLGDTEGFVSWIARDVIWDASLGVRLGEARRGTVGWGALTATWPIRDGIQATASAGSYPVDLIQGLPGGRYLAVGVRLPGGSFSALYRRPPPPRPPPPPARPELPVGERLALVIGEALDSASLREVRVWAPGIVTVELLGDFTEWVPVPLVRERAGEWVGYYRISPGTHRINVRLDREEIDVPVNLVRVRDEFVGSVGLVLVR